MKKDKQIKKKNREELIEFEKKEKEKILKLHKLGLYICIIINIILLIFIALYKYQIIFSKHQNHILNEEIFNLTSVIQFQNKTIQHRIVNFFALLYNFQNLIIENFQNLDEIYSIMLEGGIEKPEKKRLYLCYKGTFDYDDLNKVKSFCTGNELILTIKTKTGERFGGFISNFKTKVNSYYSPSLNTFLFNMDKYGVYKKFVVNNPEKAFYFNPKKEIIFGDDDLIIKNLWNNTKTHRVYSKFPKNFGDDSNTLSDLIGKENNIVVEEIEILSFI